MGQSGQISLGPAVTAWEQDARLGCLTGGLGPGLHTSGCHAMSKRGVDTEYPNQVLTLNALRYKDRV